MHERIEPTDAARIQSVLDGQRAEIIALQGAISAARALAEACFETVAWRAPSRNTFAERLTELIAELDSAGVNLAGALSECEYASRRVDELTAERTPVPGLTR